MKKFNFKLTYTLEVKAPSFKEAKEHAESLKDNIKDFIQGRAVIITEEKQEETPE